MAYKKVDGIYRQVEVAPEEEKPKTKAEEKAEAKAEKEAEKETKKHGGK